MKQCPACGAEISVNAKACPKCGARNKKPIYKSAWFIVLVIILCGVVCLKISAALNDFNVQISTDSGHVTVKASELSEIAEIDSNRFDEYYGHTATFTAEIKEVKTNIKLSNISTYYVSLLGFNHSIFAGFDESTSYNVGDKIKITGTISHSVYDDVYIDVITSEVL